MDIAATDNFEKKHHKIVIIIIIASIVFDLTYFSCKPLFDVDFIFGEAIFFSIFITLFLSFRFIPKKKVMMWIFYPLTVLAIIANFFALLVYGFFVSMDMSFYTSPNHKNTLIIQKDTFLYDTSIEIYALKAVFFKKEFNEGGCFYNNGATIESINWVDDNIAKVVIINRDNKEEQFLEFPQKL